MISEGSLEKREKYISFCIHFYNYIFKIHLKQEEEEENYVLII